MVSTCRQTITWLTEGHWDAAANPQSERGCYLVDVVSGDDGVKHGVEIVQEVYDLLSHTHTHTHAAEAVVSVSSGADRLLLTDLDGFAESRDGREADDVAEVKRALRIMLRPYRLAFLQSLSHRPATQDSAGHVNRRREQKSRLEPVSGEAISLWQELPHQLIRFGSLDLQFIRSLPDQVLQVGAVLLQHPQHGVDDVCLLSFVNAPKLQRSTQSSVLGASRAAVPARARRGRSSYLFENVVEARPLAGFLVPAFAHQAETLGGSFIHGNHRSAERRRLLQTLHDFCRRRWGGQTGARRRVSHPQAAVSPLAGMSIMAYGSVRVITSCMMMEKLKTSPANEPPWTGFLKSSGATHNSSDRQEQSDRRAGRAPQLSPVCARYLVHLPEAEGSESEGSWEVHSQ